MRLFLRLSTLLIVAIFSQGFALLTDRLDFYTFNGSNTEFNVVAAFGTMDTTITLRTNNRENEGTLTPSVDEVGSQYYVMEFDGQPPYRLYALKPKEDLFGFFADKFVISMQSKDENIAFHGLVTMVDGDLLLTITESSIITDLKIKDHFFGSFAFYENPWWNDYISIEKIYRAEYEEKKGKVTKTLFITSPALKDKDPSQIAVVTEKICTPERKASGLESANLPVLISDFTLNNCNGMSASRNTVSPTKWFNPVTLGMGAFSKEDGFCKISTGVDGGYYTRDIMLRINSFEARCDVAGNTATCQGYSVNRCRTWSNSDANTVKSDMHAAFTETVCAPYTQPVPLIAELNFNESACAWRVVSTRVPNDE